MKLSHQILTTTATAALAASLLACADKPDNTKVENPQAASVNQGDVVDLDRQAAGSPLITVGDRYFPLTVVDMYTAERAQGQPFRLLQPSDKQFISKELVHLLLLSQHAEEAGLQDSETTAAALQLQTTKVMARAALDDFFANNEPSDEELLAEYEKRRDGMKNIQLKARHILVASVTEANNLIKELDGGADFSELAKAHSTDGGSGAKGGDLGWFKPTQMVEPFADAASALEVGARTLEPVQSQFGWHIIQLDDRKELAPPPFENMKPAMTKFVQQNKVEAFLESLENKYNVVIADEVSAEPDYNRDLESLSADEGQSSHNH